MATNPGVGQLDTDDIDPMPFLNGVQEICCVGAGRDAIMSTLVMASHWPDKMFTVLDLDDTVVPLWAGNHAPINEPGLNQLFTANRQHFRVSNNLNEVIQNSGIILISMDIPTVTKGSGKGGVDLTPWETAVRVILASTSLQNKYIVEQSHFPGDVPNRIVEIMTSNGQPGHTVISNPLFFSQGSAIHDLQNPNRVVISRKTPSGNRNVLRQLYIANDWVDPNLIMFIDDYRSAEFGKIAANVILATRVTMMNIVSSIIDRTGGDIIDVRRVVSLDPRIGGAYLNVGPGIGGPGLQRDVSYLSYLAATYNLKSASRFLKELLEVNRERKETLIDVMSHAMTSLVNKRILICGFAFKAGTDDCRDTAAFYICRQLLKNEVSSLRIHDLRVPRGVIESCFLTRDLLTQRVTTVPCNGLIGACDGIDAICILTRAEQYEQDLDFDKVFPIMNRPACVFVACDCKLNYIGLRNTGFKVYVVGRPELSYKR